MFKPDDPPHEFDVTVGKISTSHQVFCRHCGHISPWTPVPFDCLTRCVLCGGDSLVHKLPTKIV